MKRTGSIASRVPPAVIKTRTPANGSGSGAGSRGGALARAASIAARISVGSCIRPRPRSPRDASAPSAGSRIVTPRSRSVAVFA